MTHSALARRVVKKDVVDLGVVVGDPERQAARLQGLGHDRRHGFPLEDEIDGVLRLAGPLLGVLLQNFLELRQPPRRVVEIRDGLVQQRGRQVGQVFLEAAERPARLARLFGPLRHVDDVAVADEPVGAPVMALRRDMAASPRFGPDQVERFALGIAARDLLEFSSQVPGDLFEIRHQPLGVVKDKVVDLLEDEPPRSDPPGPPRRETSR